MQLVINIDDEDYDDITLTGENTINLGVLLNLQEAVRSGVPLPKGHKIIDAWALQEHLALVPMEDRTYREAVEIIDRFPVITETDRSEEE